MSYALGPYTIEYHAYPCPKNGYGEPNPPAAFILPQDSDEAVALVFGHGDDPLDSPSQRANARLFAAAPNLLAACQEVLPRLAADACNGMTAGEAIAHYDCLAALVRAAITKATGGQS